MSLGLSAFFALGGLLGRSLLGWGLFRSSLLGRSLLGSRCFTFSGSSNLLSWCGFLLHDDGFLDDSAELGLFGLALQVTLAAAALDYFSMLLAHG